MTHTGYSREAGDKTMEPPLGGEPWNPTFVEELMALNEEVIHEFGIESSKIPAYGAAHRCADDRFHACTHLVMAWNTAVRFGKNPTAVGMFEVRLLSATLTAARRIPQVALDESEGRYVVRSAESYTHDLELNARVLAIYTGTSPKEVRWAATKGQRELMQYLKKRNPKEGS